MDIFFFFSFLKEECSFCFECGQVCLWLTVGVHRTRHMFLADMEYYGQNISK